MASDDELEQWLLADEVNDKNEATSVKLMPELLASLVDKVETMQSKIFNMDKSIKRLQSNSDAPCSNEGPSKNQRLTAQIEVEENAITAMQRDCAEEMNPMLTRQMRVIATHVFNSNMMLCSKKSHMIWSKKRW